MGVNTGELETDRDDRVSWVVELCVRCLSSPALADLDVFRTQFPFSCALEMMLSQGLAFGFPFFG